MLLLFTMTLNHPVMAASENNIVVFTATIGAVYGVGDAVIHQRDILKGGWDGFMLGSILPGALVGTGLGLGVGVLVDAATGKGLTEKTAVGWGSAGWVLGSTLSSQSVAMAGDRELGLGFPLLSVSLWGYYGFAGVEAIQLSRQAVTEVSGDARRHQWVSRKLKDRFDPGTALMAGAAKEADDYFFQRGTPELRDLQNDWVGVFGD